ncbi:MAG: hypothetical protein QM762_12510 [Chryseolinea sp.]
MRRHDQTLEHALGEFREMIKMVIDGELLHLGNNHGFKYEHVKLLPGEATDILTNKPTNTLMFGQRCKNKSGNFG